MCVAYLERRTGLVTVVCVQQPPGGEMAGVSEWISRGIVPLIMLSFLGAASADTPSQAPKDNAALLQALDDAAIAAYVAGRAETFANHDGPVIVVGEDMVLIANGTEKHADYTAEGYTELKTVAHITLGVVGLLHPYAEDAKSRVAAWKPLLETLLERVEAVKPILDQLDLGADAKARDRFMVERMTGFMQKALAQESYTMEELTSAARDVAPYLLASATDAAKFQIDRMDGIVKQWRAEFSPEEWSRLRVMVLGPRMPRNGYVQLAYFRFLMGEEALGKTLIYGENIFDQKGAIGLLSTILQDRAIGEIAFNDEMRMDRDMMADGAEAYLLRLFGKLGTPRP